MKFSILTFLLLLGTAQAATLPTTIYVQPTNECAKALLPKTAVMLDNYSSGPFIMEYLQERGIPVEVGATLPLPEWGAASFKIPEGKDLIEAYSVDEDLVNRFREMNVGAIFQGADSNAAFIIDVLNKRLGLPGSDPDTTSARRYKGSTQKALADAELAHIRGVTTSKLETALTFAEAVGYPLYVKPNDDGGSAYSFKVNDEKALRDAFAAVRESFNVTTGKANERVRVEAYVPGIEYATQGSVAQDPVTGKTLTKISSIIRYDKIPVEGYGDLYRSEWTIDGDSPEAKILIPYVIASNGATGTVEGAFHWEDKIHEVTKQPVGIEENYRIIGSKWPQLLKDAVGYSDAHLEVERRFFFDEFRARPDVYTLKQHAFRYMIHTPETGMTLNEETLKKIAGIPGFQRFRKTEFKDGILPKTIDLDTIPMIIEFLLPDAESVQALRTELIELQATGAFFNETI